MNRIKKIIMFPIAVILIFSIVSCGVVETSENVENTVVETENTTEPIEESPYTIKPQGNDGLYATFYEKVDGDTAWFLADGEQIKVRFLGIDTPETVKENTEVQEWGPEASEFTTDRLSNAEEIYLEFDPESDNVDAYGRTLAWIWVDGSLLEAELVSLGYAEVAYIYGDYMYVDELYKIQEQAQKNTVGIWSNNI